MGETARKLFERSMPARRKKERFHERYFTWLLDQRSGIYQADGRSNDPPLGRHSLTTRDYAEAKERLKQLDLTQAVKLGRVDATALREAQPGELTLDDGMKRYMAYVGRPRVLKGVSKKSAARYKSVFDKAIAFFKREGLATWNQVRRSELLTYAAWLDGESYAYRTEYLEITTIQQAFNFWIEEKLLPQQAKIKLSLRKPKGTDTHCWSAAEISALFARCREQPELDWLHAVLVALARTGMRISELVSLEWGDVDFEKEVITLRDESYSKHVAGRDRRSTKNRQSRWFPIHPELLTVLKTLSNNHGHERVFCGPQGRVLRPDSVRVAFIKHLVVPLSSKFPTADKEIGFRSGRLHSFRHYFASECCNSGVSEAMIMRWLGHQNGAMIRHYYHASPEEAKRQMKRLGFINGAGGA